MGKRSFIFIIVFCLLWLAACEQAAPVSLPTVTAVPPQPTATGTNPPTALPSPTMVVETAVPTTTDTPEPTITPTSTRSYPTPESPSSVPLTKFEGNYVLATPSVNHLLQVMEQAARAENLNREPQSNWSKIRLIYPLLFADISKFNIDEFPDVANVLTDSSLGLTPSHVTNWYPSDAHMHILQASILQYLNQNEIVFISGEEIEKDSILFLPTKLENISNGENGTWLVQVEASNFRIRVFLLLEQNSQGNFALLGEPLISYSLFSFSDNWLNNIYTEYDLTGDGITEIIIETGVYYSGTGTATIFDIFSWQNDEVIQFEKIEVLKLDVFEIADQTNDGIDDVQTVKNHFRNFGCAWKEVDTYSWPNLIPQHDDQDKTPPDTAVCNLWQAVYPYHSSWHPNKEENYPILSRAVSQLQEDEEISADLLAYAQSQLAFAYLEQGLDEQARATIDQIYNFPDQSSYGLYLQQHDVTGSVVDLCRNLNINASRALETELGDFLNEAAAKGRGYDWGEPSKAHICDLRYIALNRLQNVNMPSTVAPVEIIDEIDLQLVFAYSANLDNDSDLEWIGILEPEAPWLVIFDDVSGVWDIQFLDDLFNPVIALEFEQQDIIDDGQLETLLSLLIDPSYGEPYHEVLLIGRSDEKFELIDSNSDFEEQPDLSKIDATFFDLDQPEQKLQLQSDWKGLDGFDVDGVYTNNYLGKIVWYVEKLRDAVLTQSDPTIPTKITDLLAYLPTDDSEAQPYREHLTYLLGYHYELSGDEEQAVTTYLDLIQQAPSSPWSWLAWARLEPMDG